MAKDLIGFPFDHVDGDREYRATDYRKMFSTILSDGVYFGSYKGYGADSLKVVDAENNTDIEITKGVCFIDGTRGELEEDYTITLPVEAGTYYVVARLDDTLVNRKIEIDYKTVDVVYTDNIKELKLATVVVAIEGIQVSLTITDNRTYLESRGILPPYVPNGEIPELIWKYILFPDTLTTAEKESVESNTNYMNIINASKIDKSNYVDLTKYENKNVLNLKSVANNTKLSEMITSIKVSDSGSYYAYSAVDYYNSIFYIPEEDLVIHLYSGVGFGLVKVYDISGNSPILKYTYTFSSSTGYNDTANSMLYPDMYYDSENRTILLTFVYNIPARYGDTYYYLTIVKLQVSETDSVKTVTNLIAISKQVSTGTGNNYYNQYIPVIYKNKIYCGIFNYANSNSNIKIFNCEGSTVVESQFSINGAVYANVIAVDENYIYTISSSSLSGGRTISKLNKTDGTVVTSTSIISGYAVANTDFMKSEVGQKGYTDGTSLYLIIMTAYNVATIYKLKCSDLSIEALNSNISTQTVYDPTSYTKIVRRWQINKILDKIYVNEYGTNRCMDYDENLVFYDGIQNSLDAGDFAKVKFAALINVNSNLLASKVVSNSYSTTNREIINDKRSLLLMKEV